MNVGHKQEDLRDLITISPTHHVLLDGAVILAGLLKAQRAIEDRHSVHSPEHLRHFGSRDKQLPCPSINTCIEISDSSIACNGRSPCHICQTL